MEPVYINLLGNTQLLKKQRRLKFTLSMAYIMLWLFSGFTLLHIHQTNRYISTIYMKEINHIGSEIIGQSPKYQRIKYLYQQKSKWESTIADYQQKIHHPQIWLSKMIALSQLTPNNIRLNKLNTTTHPKNKEFMTFNGIAIIDADNSGSMQLNDYKTDLNKNAGFMDQLSSVSLVETRIEKSKNEPVMFFSMAVK
jgi:hypothetical protein